MSRGHLRLAAVVLSALVGVVLLALTPGSPGLGELNGFLMNRLAPAGSEVVGEGTEREPWRVERIREEGILEPVRILRMEEDPEGYFEQVPPPPADLAVLFSRLERAGLRAFGVGYPLRWEDPDVLAVAALRRVMDRFPGAVLGFPLKDSTSGEAVAAPFLRASVAYSSVQGDKTKLPVVNGIRGASPELGGERTRAGFTRLETEEDEEDRAYLLARWDDRVVVALPLVVEMARIGVKSEDLEIRIGEEIRVGRTGPRIPIDFRGRMRLPEKAGQRTAPASAVIAETLPEGFVVADVPLYLGEARLLGSKAERRWTGEVVRVDAGIRGAPRVSRLRELGRLDWKGEAVALGLVAVVTGFAFGSCRRVWIPALVVTGLVAVSALMMGFLRAGSSVPVMLAWLSVPVVAGVSVVLAGMLRPVEVVSENPRPVLAAKKKGKRGEK